MSQLTDSFIKLIENAFENFRTDIFRTQIPSSAIPPATSTTRGGVLTTDFLSNPMSSTGDLIKGGASGAPSRLAVGTNGDVLTVVAGSPAWAAGGGGGGGGDLTKIAAVDVSVATATIDFSSIPSSYRALRIVIQGRLSAAVADAFILMRLNGDTGSNYHDIYQYVTTGGAVPGSTTGQTSGKIALFAGSSAPSGSGGMAVVDIPFYAGTTYQKWARATGADMYATNSPLMADFAVRWLSTTAINQVTFLLSSGNFEAGSQATLYGLN